MKCHLLAAIALFGCLSSALALGDDQAASQKTIGFSRDVLPLLTKKNCNTAKCHGSLKGVGNLRLSPLGSDPLGDFHALAKEESGRRVSSFHPRESLLLRRLMSPASTVRLKPDSPSYRILHNWMQQGVVGPDPKNEPRLLRLETSPVKVRLAKGNTADIAVRATWSDGVTRDVTQWATFHSDVEEFAKVDTQGQVSAIEPGIALVQARFLDQTVAVPVLIPQNETETEFPWTPNNFVDSHVAETWRAAGLQPADVVNHVRFSRRVHLQLTGLPPTSEQQKAFLADDRPDKRQRLIDRLLASPQYAEVWADVWAGWLLEDRWVNYGGGDWRQAVRTSKHPRDGRRLRNWLLESLKHNLPVDRLAREVLTATGNTAENGAAVFYAAHPTPDDMARAAARSLLGVNVSCSRCHDHPHAPWDADDFSNLAACFANVKVEVCVDATRVRGVSFQLANPGRGKLEAYPTFKTAFQHAAQSERPREALAAWINKEGRRLLARNVVNRYWTVVFARSLAGPPDDLHPANPGSHPELLDALTRDFLRHDCDVQHLLRTICNSRLYQLDSQPKPGSERDRLLFNRFPIRRVQGDQLRRVIEFATETRLDPFKASHASKIPPLVEDPIQCSRDRYHLVKSNFSYGLHLINDNFFESIMKQPQSLPNRLIKSGKSDDEVMDEMYHAILCRPPRADERQLVRKHFAKVGRKEVIEDVVWALMNTKEFLFNQ